MFKLRCLTDFLSSRFILARKCRKLSGLTKEERYVDVGR